MTWSKYLGEGLGWEEMHGSVSQILTIGREEKAAGVGSQPCGGWGREAKPFSVVVAHSQPSVFLKCRCSDENSGGLRCRKRRFVEIGSRGWENILL